MNQINAKENNFQISVRHNFPVERREIKYTGKCKNCGEKYMYRKRIKNIACKKCCKLFFNGSWNKNCHHTNHHFLHQKINQPFQIPIDQLY